MRQRFAVLATGFLIFLGAATAHAQTFIATLSGAAEIPPVATAGSGTATVILNVQAHTLRVITSFTGLASNTTMAHIHCCAVQPANVGVATTTPSFVGFPIGVTNGSMDQTYNTLDASTWNGAFVTANGGTAAGAEAALSAGLNGTRAYLNIHTVNSPGGEIRGILLPGPTGLLIPTLSQAVMGVLVLLLVATAGWVLLRRRRA